MAKANVIRPDGTKVTIEGSPEEVAALLVRIESVTQESQSSPARRSSRSAAASSRTERPANRAKPKGPADYIRDLIDGDFFSAKRAIGEVQSKLEEQARIYPVTHLSPALFRLVKARELRRIKEDGQWRYVNP